MSAKSKSKLKTDILIIAVFLAVVLVVTGVLILSRPPPSSNTKLRLGYFPNMTHGPALYGVYTGIFQQYIGNNTTLETKTFNAGPTAITALLANDVDIIYVGPSPTISGLAASGSDVLRIISGAASGGALFVVHPNIDLNSSANYSGKKFATPQLGNTQDVALKHYLLSIGHNTKDKGGDVDVINAQNSDILTLFKQHQIDGAWVPEPWATRLVLEGGGKVVFDERTLWPNSSFVTTHIVTTKSYLENHQDIVKKFLDANIEAINQINSDPAHATSVINDAIFTITGSRLADNTITASINNLNFTYDPLKTSFETQMQWSKDLGFISALQDTNAAYGLRCLNEVLSKRGLPVVK